MDPDPVEAARPPRRRGLRVALRRAGLVFQVVLCAVLAVWTATAGEVVFTIVAGLLLILGLVLLIREIRGRVPGVPGHTSAAGSAAGADLGEGTADRDADETEGGQ